MARGKFGTAINCMDGRVQIPMTTWMKDRFGLDYVDMITEAGPDKIVSEGEPAHVKLVRNKTELSIEKHGSEVVVIMGHDDCGGNPVPKERHFEQIKAAMQVIKSWNLPVSIYGVWLETDWKPQIIDSIERV